MPISRNSFHHFVLRLKVMWRGNHLVKPKVMHELPLRAELFSNDQMKEYGKTLAHQHELANDSSSQLLLKRLTENETVLADTRDLLAAAVKANRLIVPAGEWLLDNFYLIEEQIHTAKKHLPKGYHRELPLLANGPGAGLPRVYDIALETIAHGDGRVDPDSLSDFVAAYESVTSLKLGELWAIPIMLRLALIENLRRVSIRMAETRNDRNLADFWADEMITVVERDPKSLILVVADMARSNPPQSSAFIAEFTRRLQGQNSALALPLSWVKQWISDAGSTIEQLVHLDNQYQAADQVSISNSIGSLRLLSAMDWREFVESMSRVENTLRQDPSGSYAQMSFGSRDKYRHVVEHIAKHSDTSEEDVAKLAVQLAIDHSVVSTDKNDPRGHVGYYLIEKGRVLLEQKAKATFSFLERWARAAAKIPLFLYLGGIILITGALTAVMVHFLYTQGISVGILIAFTIALLIALSQLALELVNGLSTVVVNPHQLMRMDFTKGIPDELRTLTIIPTMMLSPTQIDHLIESLEVRFLANRDRHLHFGLLTDFCDANQEHLPDDDELVQHAKRKITQLNIQYKKEKEDIFFLFHRPRRWNAQESVWMGYERKRGKLADLNSILRGGSRSCFSVIVGDIEVLQGIKYVITLDTDTQMPRDCARQLIETLVHPLNRTYYGILQPRVSMSLPGNNRSTYARLYGGESGIDPYTRMVSDVYQDVFQEGSFIGKGIYDIDVFEQKLKGRFVEGAILSHDLWEGCYAHCGLLSDVSLYEEYPHSYSADVKRRHRWIRGDWQLLPWLWSLVPTAAGGKERNTLSVLSQWKILDNLRRSLVPAALVTVIVGGWIVLPHPWIWTMVGMGIVFIPLMIASVMDLLHKSKDIPVEQHVITVIQSMGWRFAQGMFNFACIPYEAFFSLDAIIRTLGRMFITRKHLLEWNASSNDTKHHANDLIATCQAMWIAPFLSIALFIFLTVYQPIVLIIAIPILLAWGLSPVVAWWISRPLDTRGAQLNDEEYVFLKKVSRRTWEFFDQCVSVDDNWLPPDNYQENRADKIAHRTSPTNIGLALLSNMSAYDFGYITCDTLIKRTRQTLETMVKLKRYRGHFYNWYDTQTLQPLLPMYVSTVDSGNLAGHLITLRCGLLDMVNQPIINAQWGEGLRDTFEILMESIENKDLLSLERLHHEIESICAQPSQTLIEIHASSERLNDSIKALIEQLSQTSQMEAIQWANAFATQCQHIRQELIVLAPWVYVSNLPAQLQHNPVLKGIPTLSEVMQLNQSMMSWIDEYPSLKKIIQEASSVASQRVHELERLAYQAGEFSWMEYEFLYDKTRCLFSVGYHVEERKLDTSFYDLLASEVRLSCFIAIAQGQVPQDSWFALGRLLTTGGGDPILMSWSGSMFEYLMPLLVMPTYDNTLLDQTCRAAVDRQIEYGKQRGVAWGISESGYNTIDAALNYQYRAFGVPGLGLKRGLGEDLVIAPYASALALMVNLKAACHNLQRLAQEGALGSFGFYEAIDYTASRQRRGETRALLRSFMAHHQGMSLLSLAYVLLDRPMQKRFEADPLVKATLLLLQEKIPKAVPLYTHTSDIDNIRTLSTDVPMPIRVVKNPNSTVPEVQLLSNGRYHVMVTNAGGGYSRWKDIALTRWREDTTCDNWGAFCYIRDVETKEFWSTTHQPTLKVPDHYEAIFSEGRAEFRRRDNDIDVHTEIVISPEDDIELRRVRLTNRSRVKRTLDVTSYGEVVLAPSLAEALHPMFSNLFIQTEIIHQRQAILCSRRPRAKEEHPPWMFHLMAVHGAHTEAVTYETDRMQFIGRSQTVTAPDAMTKVKELSNSQGSVLDPVVAICSRFALEPEQTVVIDIVSGISPNREDTLTLVSKYQDRRIADRVFELAWTHSQVVLRQLNATETDAQLYARLANSILYANPLLRVEASVILQNHRGQSGLWGYSISGDLPIVLLKIGDISHIELVRQMVQAHAYWRLKGLAVDLVIWNEAYSGYQQLLQEQIMGLIAASAEGKVADRSGEIFVKPVEQISQEDRILLQTVARAIITDSRGTLANQINRRPTKEIPALTLVPTKYYRPDIIPDDDTSVKDLIFFNGLGGFSPDGREYVIRLNPGQVTPAPWVNVLANTNFGTVVSENGLAYTWSKNAHEFRLTPWNNDPVTDYTGEAFYLRDEETGHFWSATPMPSRSKGSYTVRHGFGYSVFEHNEDGIQSELWVYVALDAAVKYSVLKIRNLSGRPRRISATAYVEWVLGDMRSKSAMHVNTEIDSHRGALYARNPYNTEFADTIAFFDVADPIRTITADRNEFIGRNGTIQNPAAMSRSYLSGKTGPALDPCGAIQVVFDLLDGKERSIVFTLGIGQGIEEARNLVQRYCSFSGAHKNLDAVKAYWKRTLGAVQVQTPDLSLNIMTNGWFVYQTLVCRLWARSGYYQSGGAFGFRDQLQDVMALMHTEPRLMREHLLTCAGQQFIEGDVQHWWHPPSGRGVRTHCSDDFLWLPLAVSRYVLGLGDTGILNERIHFLQGRAVKDEEDSYYDMPTRSSEIGTLYEHCQRAILRGLRFGVNGLPLMGSCDWNDGMNLVGIHGKGESIWLGFFLYEVLMQFIKVAQLKNDTAFVTRCQDEADQLRLNLEKNGWDGQWYRRAYFDDGTPLGSSSNTECQIDSIAQSWSVLSGAGDVKRSQTAMTSLHERLVRPQSGIIQLLDPPFDKSDLNPGYIKGYVPGVRENGGQYTHAAIWAAMAFARLGDSTHAWELLAMINPINHAKTPQDIAVYKVEPYVIAADVYGVSPHVGRGGWTWYTGSAGWMYRLIIESLLGLRLDVDQLYIEPCLPSAWKSFRIDYRYRETFYHIDIIQVPSDQQMMITVDGIVQEEKSIPLDDDRKEHTVNVTIPTQREQQPGRSFKGAAD